MPRYDTEVTPPAAFVQVQIANPTTGASQPLSVKLDTGASVSVIPGS